MTRVRIVGDDDYDIRHELLSSATSSQALATYEFLETPIENAVELETATLGSALSLLNDLDWYLTRYADWVEVLEPSVSDDEWLSRDLATRLYERDLEPEETRGFYAVRGVKDGESLEPLYTRGSPSEYDLDETDFEVVTRISEDEFGEG
ncbi:MAG: DUF5804 family protein [Halobacteria archaeon]|nr:DUF5804 family protein [Halobacteria archaeon]